MRIGYNALIAPAFLPGIPASFVPDPRDVELRFEECDNHRVQEGLRNGTHGVIHFVSEGARRSVDFETLIEARPCCLLPEAHRSARQPSVTLAEIAKEPLVVLNRSVTAACYVDLFDPRVQDVFVAAYASSTDMVQSLVSDGHGCAILNMRPLTQVSYIGSAVLIRLSPSSLP